VARCPRFAPVFWALTWVKIHSQSPMLPVTRSVATSLSNRSSLAEVSFLRWCRFRYKKIPERISFCRSLAANLHPRSGICRQLSAVRPHLSAASRQRASNSLFRNILRITYLNWKIWREILGKSMIPKDRDIRGRDTPISRWSMKPR